MREIFKSRNFKLGSPYLIINSELTSRFFEPHCNQRTEISFLVCKWEEVAREPSSRYVLDRPNVLHICWIFSFTANPDSVQLKQT
jgi:hypothetical protein